MSRAVERLVDAVAQEALRLMAQPNFLGMPEDVRLDMAITMAYERFSLMGSDELDAAIEARVGAR
jgi:hypothetical protein